MCGRKSSPGKVLGSCPSARLVSHWNKGVIIAEFTEGKQRDYVATSDRFVVVELSLDRYEVL